MWKYLKGTEKDFEYWPIETQIISRKGFLLVGIKETDQGILSYLNATYGWQLTTAQTTSDLNIIAQREWVEEFYVETKPEQQPLPDMNPAKDLPKIKLDVKKPVFYKETNEVVRFIHSNNLYHLFEKEDCTILNVTTDNLDNCFYNKPETKTTVEVLDSAWKRACNAGFLWASPTQLFYMAIEQLVKDGVVDMNKVYEVKQ